MHNKSFSIKKITLLIFVIILLNSCGNTDKVDNKSTSKGNKVNIEKVGDKLKQEVKHEKKVEKEVPELLKKVGFEKLNDLTLVEMNAVGKETGFSKAMVKYEGDNYEKIIKDAEVLAGKMNIEENGLSPRKSIQKILETIDSLPMPEEEKEKEKQKQLENAQGAIFANCMRQVCNEKYNTAIIVEKKGDKYYLNVVVIDIDKYNSFMKKFNK